MAQPCAGFSPRRTRPPPTYGHACRAIAPCRFSREICACPAAMRSREPLGRRESAGMRARGKDQRSLALPSLLVRGVRRQATALWITAGPRRARGAARHGTDWGTLMPFVPKLSKGTSGTNVPGAALSLITRPQMDRECSSRKAPTVPSPFHSWIPGDVPNLLRWSRKWGHGDLKRTAIGGLRGP